MLVEGASVYAITSRSIVLGQLEPKLASLMIKLLHLGNQYLIAVAAIAKDQLSIVIREIYRHPNMRSSVSFPISTQNHGDYLHLIGEELVGKRMESIIIEEFGEIDDIEPEVDASTEERGFNQAEIDRGIIDPTGDDNYREDE